MNVRRYIRQLADESAIYGLSGVLGKSMGLLLVPIYTRIFTPEDYGIIALLAVFGSLVGMIAVLALDNSSARWFYDTDDPQHRRVTISSWFWCQLSVGSCFALILCAFAPQVAGLLTDSSEYANLIRLVAIGIPFATGGKVLGNWLRYQRRARAAVVFSLVQTLGGISFIILFVVVLRQGLAGLFTAQLITTVIVAVVAVVMLRDWISLFSFSWHRLRPMLHYALPLIPASVCLWVMMSMDRIMLKQFVAISEIGLYSVGAVVASAVALLTSAFSQAWGPFAYSILKEEDSGRVYSRVLDLYSFLGCAACAGLALFAPMILRILTTEAYYPAISTVGLLAFGTLLNGGRFIAGLGCGIAKKSIPSAISVVIGAGVNLGLNLLLIPHLGREGAALATMLAWGFSLVFLFWASQRLYPIPFRWFHALAPFAFAWSIIALDHWLFDGNGLMANVGRGLLLLGFIPFGVLLGLYRWRDMNSLIRSLRR